MTAQFRLFSTGKFQLTKMAMVLNKNDKKISQISVVSSAWRDKGSGGKLKIRHTRQW